MPVIHPDTASHTVRQTARQAGKLTSWASMGIMMVAMAVLLVTSVTKVMM